MTEKEPQISKWERLKGYLDAKEHTEILLLDLLRNWELSQQDYNQMIRDSEAAYRQFLSDLKNSNEPIKRGNLWQGE